MLLYISNCHMNQISYNIQVYRPHSHKTWFTNLTKKIFAHLLPFTRTLGIQQTNIILRNSHMEGAFWWDHELLHNKMDTRTKTMKIEKLHKLLSRFLNFSSQPLQINLCLLRRRAQWIHHRQQNKIDLHYSEKQPIALPTPTLKKLQTYSLIYTTILQAPLVPPLSYSSSFYPPILCSHIHQSTTTKNGYLFLASLCTFPRKSLLAMVVVSLIILIHASQIPMWSIIPITWDPSNHSYPSHLSIHDSNGIDPTTLNPSHLFNHNGNGLCVLSNQISLSLSYAKVFW